MAAALVYLNRLTLLQYSLGWYNAIMFPRDDNRPVREPTRKHKNNYIMSPTPFKLDYVDERALADYAKGLEHA